jgi:hypothetical protein
MTPAEPNDPPSAYLNELRVLAFDPSTDFEELEQDWDVCNTSEITVPLFYEFVEDPKCPHRRFFLHCLYIHSATIARDNDFEELDECTAVILSESDVLAKLLTLAKRSSLRALQNWARRTTLLLTYPNDFNYDEWCGGGFAYAETEPLI